MSKKKGKNKFFKYKVEADHRTTGPGRVRLRAADPAELTELAGSGFEEKDVYTVCSRKELRDVARELDD